MINSQIKHVCELPQDNVNILFIFDDNTSITYPKFIVNGIPLINNMLKSECYENKDNKIILNNFVGNEFQGCLNYLLYCDFDNNLCPIK